MEKCSRFACTVGFALLLLVGLSAQSNRWYDAYQKGLKAFDAKDYAMAITFLQQAVAADPKASANKYVEGVFRTDYFPYYYLGVAYLETRQYDKAQENFGKARNGLSRALTAKLDEYEKRRTTEASLARRGGPPSSPAANAAPPPKAGPDPNFGPALQEADTALAAKRYADAVTKFEAAKKIDAGEFGKVNAQARLDEADRGAKGLQLAEEAQRLLTRSQFSAAKSRFQQADQQLPGQKSVADGLALVKQHEDTYQRLKTGAEQDLRSNNVRPALDKFAQAKAAHPEQFAEDKLDARVKTATERLKDASATTASPDTGTKSARGGSTPTTLAESKTVAPSPAVPPVAPQEPDKDTAALRNALVALLKGDAQQSASILEPAAAKADSNAALHAYLGVAYATEALSAPKPDESSQRLRDKAMVEFRLALKAQRNYQLSARIVSPRIVALFESARTS